MRNTAIASHSFRFRPGLRPDEMARKGSIISSRHPIEGAGRNECSRPKESQRGRPFRPDQPLPRRCLITFLPHLGLAGASTPKEPGVESAFAREGGQETRQGAPTTGPVRRASPATVGPLQRRRPRARGHFPRASCAGAASSGPAGAVIAREEYS